MNEIHIKSDAKYIDIHHNDVVNVDISTKKPASKELEEASEKYYQKEVEDTKCHHAAYLTYAQGFEDALRIVKSAFKAGANWQLNKIRKEYEKNAEIIESFEKQREQKPAWSEEDENEYNHTLKILKLVAVEQETNGYNNLIGSINWLQSLKEKYTWKPSNEQIKGIKCAIKTLQHQLNVGDKRLDSLYDDLKKLR